MEGLTLNLLVQIRDSRLTLLLSNELTGIWSFSLPSFMSSWLLRGTFHRPKNVKKSTKLLSMRIDYHLLFCPHLSWIDSITGWVKDDTPICLITLRTHSQ